MENYIVSKSRIVNVSMLEHEYEAFKNYSRNKPALDQSVIDILSYFNGLKSKVIELQAHKDGLEDEIKALKEYRLELTEDILDVLEPIPNYYSEKDLV